MKKVLALAVVFVLVLSLAACGTSQTTGSDAGNQAEEAQTYATQNITDFVALAGSKLNMSDYEIEDCYQNGTWIKLNRKETAPAPELKITIDGTEIALPVKYTDLIDAGWTDDRNIAETELDKDTITSTAFRTTAGKSVAVWFVNTDEDKKKIKDLNGVKLKITNASTDAAATYDPPAFTLFGSVGNDSDLAGILDANKTPSYLSILDKNDPKSAVVSTIKYKNGGDSIEIEYYYTKNCIMTITMESGISNTIINY